MEKKPQRKRSKTGRFVKKKTGTKLVAKNFTIRQSQYDRIKKIADEKDISVSQELRNIISAYFKSRSFKGKA